MKKITINLEIELEVLQATLAEKFPNYQVRISGLGPGRRVIVSKGLFCGVDVGTVRNQLFVRGSLMPSKTALVLFGVGCAAGLIGGLLIGLAIGANGSRLEAEVADALVPFAAAELATA